MTELIRCRSEEEGQTTPCLSPEQSSKRGGMWGVQRRASLDVLMAAWGLGTWLGVNGLYVQLPLLVARLPEGWTLASNMVLAIQLANVGIPAYALLRRVAPRVSDATYIYALLATGALALFLNAPLHGITSTVGGSERSVAYLVLTFFAALVGCTSSVLFYPYLRHFRDAYLATYLVGEGLSGFLPSLLALAQGVGGEPECLPSEEDPSALVAHRPPPRFDTAAFLVTLGALATASLASFVAINTHRGFASERVAAAAAAKDEEATAPRESLLAPRWAGVLALTAALNALANGVLPSVQPYSAGPYGARALHLAVTLSAMANPAACLAGVWLRPARAPALAALLTAACAPLGYIVATALRSPEPPLRGAAGGEALVVASWVAAVGAVSYGRMWVYGWARGGGARGMRACGVATQLGSALGSAALYVLINHTALFVQAPDCPRLALVAPGNYSRA